MGQAKMRAAQIAELKAKGPKKQQRKKRLLGQVEEAQVAHFNSLAAKAKALSAYPQQVEIDGKTINLRAPRNSVEVAAEANAGRISPKLVHSVPVKIKTPIVIEPTAQPKQPLPITLVREKGFNQEEFFIHLLAMADITKGAGFRQPSAKAKNWGSTSLIEQHSIKMGISEPNAWEGSERGNKKRAAQIECNARIVLDRLIEEYPDRVRQAKETAGARMRNWFVGMVMEALSSTPKLEDLEVMVWERLQKVKVPKHVIEFDEFKQRAIEEAKRRVENAVLDRQVQMEAAA